MRTMDKRLAEATVTGQEDQAGVGRSARKRAAILAAATSLFLRQGFRGTSMEEIATQAGVSKQTVYTQFNDKEQLFRAIVAGASENAASVSSAVGAAFGDERPTSAPQLEALLARVARAYLDAVLQPQVIALRRLLISEAEQFPDLAAGYYAQGPSRGIDLVASRLEPYFDSGVLASEDRRLAAAHFAYLALAVAQDRALFAPDDPASGSERDRLAAAAAHAFVSGYGVPATL